MITNENILEAMLKYIKEQAKQGNAPYYNSIMNTPQMRGNFKSLARRIVETEEKEPVHTNPEEYTLEDIIDFVIIYEMTKQSGNAEVFESAAEEEFEIIKKGPVFQYYREMLFPDERMAQSNNIMNGETNTQVRQNVV